MLTQFEWVQFYQHTVCYSWCYQADCCHHLLTLILPFIHTILRHIRNSKYALADCSLIFSFLSNYDPPCVCSIGTVGVATHFFTDDNLKNIDLAIPHVSLDGPISLTCFLTQWPKIWKNIIYIDVKTKIKPNIIAVNFLTNGSLFKLQICLTNTIVVTKEII